MPDKKSNMHEMTYKPTNQFVEQSNVYAFMQEHDIEGFEELHERTVSDIEGEPASGPNWFWDEVVDHLDLDFYEAYDQVRDDTDGPQFTDWYVGGKLNIAHNVVDSHAAPASETRNKVATIWEGEDGEVREITYHELHQ
jgi:acetyl-CoA synthetase